MLHSVGIARLAVLSALLGLSACSDGAPEQDSPASTVSTASTAPRLEPRRMAKTQEGCTPAPDGTGCSEIVLEYLEAVGESPAREAINHWVRARILPTLGDQGPAESVEAMVEGFLAENKAFREDFPDAPGSWAVERKVTLTFQNPRVLTLTASDYSYTGGAHPLMVELLASFDLEAGRPLMLSDLLRPGYPEPLTALVEAELKRVRGLAPETDLLDEGFFLEEGFRLTDNFGVLADGLRFYYNPYEIGPYVLGPTDLTVPYAALAEWIPEDGILGAIQQ
jgi:hypothetical protein